VLPGRAGEAFGKVGLFAALDTNPRRWTGAS